jgi:FKBP-type peptidyl-prolyl cis-trans isomerase 2
MVMKRFFLIDYKVREGDQTIEERKNFLLITNSNFMLPSLEAHILDAYRKGETEIEVKLQPKDAFGERDPDKVVLVSLNEFKKRGINPKVGMEVNLNDQIGRIISVSGGRVKVDLNHPLAGRTLDCEVKIIKEIKQEIEKIEAICKQYFKKVKIEEGPPYKVFVPLGDNYKAKLSLANDLFLHTNLKEFEFVEFVRKVE